jgi:Spy/CpxP family protein refolding chaperone
MDLNTGTGSDRRPLRAFNELLSLSSELSSKFAEEKLMKIGKVTILALCIASLSIIAYAQGHDNFGPGSPDNEGFMNAPAGAGHPGAWGPGGGGPGHEAMREKLGLSDDQEKEMRAKWVVFQEKTRQNRTALISLMDEKRTMIVSGKLDKAKLEKMDEEIVKLRTELLREKLKMKRDRLSILTPEQVAKLGEMGFHRGKGFGGCGGRGPGHRFMN